MGKSQHKHGAFKQVNKKHKVRFLKHKDENKFGKSKGITLKQKFKALNSKMDRCNKKNQMRQNKINLNKLNKLSLAGQKGLAPFVITIIYLCDSHGFSEEFINNILSEESNNVAVQSTANKKIVIKLLNLERRILFQVPDLDSSLSDILDLTKVSDFILFVLPPIISDLQAVINATNTNLLECIISQGLPNSLFVYQDSDDDVLSVKSLCYQDSYKRGFAKLYHELLQKYLPKPSILHASKVLTPTFLHDLAHQKSKNVQWLTDRPLMMADYLEFLPEHSSTYQNSSVPSFSLKISGFLKTADKPFLADQLIYIPDIASCNSPKNFQTLGKNRENFGENLHLRINQVHNVYPDPYTADLNDVIYNKSFKRKNSVCLQHNINMDDTNMVLDKKCNIFDEHIFKKRLAERSMLIDSSQGPDGRPLFYETGMNTNNEISRELNGVVTHKDYVHSDAPKIMEGYVDDTNHASDQVEMSEIKSVKFATNESEYMEETELDFTADSINWHTEDVSCAEDNNDNSERKGEFIRLPANISAKQRLRKYRGLKSFTESVWHTDNTVDDLPPNYSSLMQFENYKKSVNYIDKFMRELWNEILMKRASACDSKDEVMHETTTQHYNSQDQMETLEYENINNNENRDLHKFLNKNHNLAKRRHKNSMSSSINSISCRQSAYYTLTVPNVTIDMKEKLEKLYARSVEKNSVVLIYGLLPYEQNYSMVNFAIRKSFASASLSNFDDNQHSVLPITEEYETDKEENLQKFKSKGTLLFQVGFRRFYNCPVFSEHSLNADKHKYERHFTLDNHLVHACSMYTNITLKSVPILVFKPLSHGDDCQNDRSIENGAFKCADNLIAIGSLYNTDPSRLIIKRIILTGQPYKINGRYAVVRFMFYNVDDINWFKPIELRTKLGRTGHIREPVGTHGHMKCIFNATLKPNDVIYMYLYKRVFPKWKQCNI